MVKINKIMCAVDFSEISPKVASYAELLARTFKASLWVVYANPGLTEYVSYHVPSTPIDKLEKIVAEISAQAEKDMDVFVRENFSNIKVRSKILSGFAPDQILKFARDEDIDLIVMGTHGRRGINKVLFGSVADRVVKTAPIPVMTIRP
jgi:nucleotide-binding universal stress UspA family protein